MSRLRYEKKSAIGFNEHATIVGATKRNNYVSNQNVGPLNAAFGGIKFNVFLSFLSNIYTF